MSAATAPRQASLGRSSAVMAAGTMVSRVLGLVRQAMLLVCVGGIGLTADAFQTSNTLPNYVFMLLSGGILNAVLIPQITKAMKREDGGQDIVNRLLTACFAVIGLVTVIATAASPVLVSLMGLRGEGYDLALFFAWICLPQIAFYGLFAVLGQVLNARGRFAAFMWSPVLANVVQIIGMAIFIARFPHRAAPHLWTSEMVWLLAGSMTLGIVAQALFLAIPLWQDGFRYTPRWGFRGYGFGAASKVAGWAFAALVVAQLGGFFTTAMLNRAAHGDHPGPAGQPGVPGAMLQAAAFAVFMLPHGIITTSILTALYPRMARAYQDGNRPELRRDLTQGIKLPMVMTLPITGAGMVLAAPIMGALNPTLRPEEIADAAVIFAVMILGLIPFGLTTLQQRYYFAREDGRTNFWLQALLTVIQMGFAVAALLVAPRDAAVTIAWGMTLGNFAAAAAFLWHANRQVGGLPLAETTRLTVRLTLATVVGMAAAWLVDRGLDLALPTTWYTSYLFLAIGGLAFIGVFLAAATAMHIREVADVLAPLTRRLRRPAARERSS